METADFESHRIVGLAFAALRANRPANFDVPLISHIVGNIWMGGVRDGIPLPEDFINVVSLYQDERYVLGPNTKRWDYELEDAEETPNREFIWGIAAEANLFISEGKTLIHCQAGLNRSGMVTALALIQTGYTPEQAIQLLREKRSPVVLCNRTFESWLLEQGSPYE